MRKLKKNYEIPKKISEWLGKFLENFTLNLKKFSRKSRISKFISRTFESKNFIITECRLSINHKRSIF